MKKSSRVYAYIADLSKSKTGYNILFYDFPGCVSAGKTLEETIKNGKIALQMHIEGMMEDKEKIPEPSTLEKIIKSELISLATREYIKNNYMNIK